MPHSSFDPYPFRSESTHLWLYGDWGKGGVALLADGGHHAKVRLAATQFDVLALLVHAATDQVPETESWAPRGFRSPLALSRALVRRSGGDPRQSWFEVDPKQVIRTVYRLRQRLGCALWPDEANGRAWVARFLEYVEPLGYRLSTPPAHLRLVLLEELESKGLD